MDDIDAEELTLAESLYAAWRRERRRSSPGDFEELCAQHPGLTGALLALHEDYEGIGFALGMESSSDGDSSAAPPSPPFAALIEHLRARGALAQRYRAGSSLGEGGMGTVQVVEDPDLRRPMAKKTLREGRGGERDAGELDPRLLGQFIQEAQITAQLTHPGVVPVHELGVDDAGRIYYTMAQVQGRTLGEIFDLTQRDAEGWTLTRAVGVLQRVCETLSYAHTRGVIHRDLKPANVMVGSFGEVYVMDWGLAKVGGGGAASEALSHAPLVRTDRREISDRATFADLRTQSGSVAGTLGYMAPEQARGEVDALDARTDVYAVGAMLYKLLSGLLPCETELGAYHRARDQAAREGFSGQAHQALQRLLEAISAGRYEPLAALAPGAPAELVSIAGRALATRPEERYPDAGALGDDLRAWLEGRVVSAHESGPWAELRKWVGRNKPLAGALLGGVLVLLAGLAGMYTVEAKGRNRIQAEQARTLRLADTRTHAQLSREFEAGGLWPALPQNLGVIESWLERAGGLLAEREQHERDLVHLEASSLPALPGEAGPRFARQTDAWQHDVLTTLLDNVETLARQAAAIETWHERAVSLDELTLGGPAARARWDEARASIAALPAYGGFELAPQLGLLPLRADPASGLWEFWHALSGAEPELDPASDRWRVEEATGVVLILIPGGTYLVGSREVPDGHAFSDEYKHHDRSDALNHTVELDPYFISRYELTQGQWRRAMGQNPSRGREGPETHPADMVSWDGAFEALRRLDLEMPTEAQWEVAARAGADTRFYTGALWQSLVGHVVLLPDANLDYVADVDEDGKVVELFGRPWRSHHEPVGSCLPNPFGLHDVHGNVWEWCLDGFDTASAPRPGDGLRLAPSASKLRVRRGGAFKSPWPNARLTYRYPWEPHNSEADVGVRAARAVR